MNTATSGAEPKAPQAEKNSEMSGNRSDVSRKKVNAVNPDAHPADPQEPAPAPELAAAPRVTKATPDYSIYLSTAAAKAAAHGIFVVTPDPHPKDAIHTTKKMPETQGNPPPGEGGVKSFAMTAAVAVKTTTGTRLLGRRFGAGDGIIAIDCDGWHPPADWTRGTGYREVSASGTGDHIIARISIELVPSGINKIKRPHAGGGDIEIFYGRGNGIAISGRDATAGPIDLDMDSEAGRLVTELLANEGGTPNKRENITATQAGRSDDEVIYLVKKTQKGRALWSGDTSGYPSPSEADAALMVMLADITGENKWQMMQLFLSSGLGKREKAGRPDYIRRTAESACEYVTKNNTHTPTVVVYEDDDEPDETEDTYDYAAEDAAIKSLMDRAPEPLKALVNYYNAISPIYQPLFAVESSIVAACEVLSRNWMTDRLTFTGMPMPHSTLNDCSLVIAPSGHGKDVFKDHLQTAIDDPNISMPTGASSRSALHKKLQAYPRTLMIMDEAGKNIAASGSDPSGIKQGAETFAMEIYGRTGRIEPQDYADTKDSPILKTIIRHGLGMVRTTTPETIAAAITYKEVRDGWLPRHRVVVSYRPRPKTIGEYQPNPKTKDPKELLSAWNAWKGAHIGIPKADTHRQAVNPITACVWGYNAPQGVIWNAEDMRNKRLGYEVGRIHPAAETEKVVCDEPIIIKWTAGAPEEISRIYAENEAIPPDNYTCMRHRKVAHIIKIAATIAVLKDNVTETDMIRIHRKYTESEKGIRALSDEQTAKKAYIDACGELEKALKSKAKNATKRQQTANAAKTTAEHAYTSATIKADLEVRLPIRDAAAAALGEKITAEDVRWARDYINLLEGPAKKLIDEELTDIGFIAAMDGLIAYLTKRGGGCPEWRITKKCAAVKRLDDKHLLKQFWDYAQDTGLVTADMSNRGRRWHLVAQQPPAPTQKEKEPQPTHSEGYEKRQLNLPCQPHHQSHRMRRRWALSSAGESAQTEEGPKEDE